LHIVILVLFAAESYAAARQAGVAEVTGTGDSIQSIECAS